MRTHGGIGQLTSRTSDEYSFSSENKTVVFERESLTVQRFVEFDGLLGV